MTNLNLTWLTSRKAPTTPVSFGTPWARGKLQPQDAVHLTDTQGNSYPLQTKINAYWPDGSVKWLHHSSVLPTDRSYILDRGESDKPKNCITATQDEDGTVDVNSELLSCQIAVGPNLISKLVRKTSQQKPLIAKLTAYIEQQEITTDIETSTIYKLLGQTDKITLEESGPIRVVVKCEGVHETPDQKNQLFPFVVRLYFFTDSDQMKIVHSFIYNANEQTDFLRGVAVEFHVAASGDLYNRHLGFTGDTGMFYEAIQPMYGGRSISPLYNEQQLAGQFVDTSSADDRFMTIVEDNASWGDFRLEQNACDHYTIVKRTKPNCAYITAAQGNRSQGTIFFGSPDTILSIGIKDFWQKAPRALEMTGATTNQPVVTAWLYSKYGTSYDFRAYDTVSHKYSYGGINNHPDGIANTNEIFVQLHEDMPGKQAIFDFASDVQTDSLLIADLETYQTTEVFGSYWLPAAPEYQDPAAENALLGFVDYYSQEVEQRKWYGFWDYGDVMHTYDPVRHYWRYDVGGYAWQNTELCNTYVNWLTFLRSGDYNIYRFARAMTRHTSEVDIYHSGKYAMLGTRHNVRHWGCGAKEPRISMAGHHRFFYYLTGDERIGDIMDFVKDADHATLVRDPMGSYFEHVEGHAHIRTGPDWSSFVINWMTAWERTNNPVYRDKILNGLNSLKAAPNRLASGSTFLYNPDNNVLGYLGEGNYQYHMVVCFGGPETWFELADLLQDEELKDMLAQFGAYYAMTPEERHIESNGLFNQDNDQAWRGERFAIRMIAYAGYRLQNQAWMDKAWQLLHDEPDWGSNTPGKTDQAGNPLYTDVADIDSIRKTTEVEFANTNGISQWSLNYMETARLRELLGKNKR